MHSHLGSVTVKQRLGYPAAVITRFTYLDKSVVEIKYTFSLAQLVNW
jgi:hypothetical protein